MPQRSVVLLVILILMLFYPTLCLSKGYQYISAPEVKQKIESRAPMILVDIQVEEEFEQHNIVGSVSTYAYPVKSSEDKAKIAPIINTLKQNDDQVVVVCPRGGGGAKRAYNLLLDSGIAEERLAILTDGQAGWPYPDLLTQNP
jgi:thiosulfate/3-mercaptopyruvate sulfurtransferase